MANDQNEKLTTSSAARLRRVSEGTIRKWANDGRLPSERTDTGIRLFNRHDVENVAAPRPPVQDN
jgi:excisionase family DNA binding protein